MDLSNLYQAQYEEEELSDCIARGEAMSNLINAGLELDLNAPRAHRIIMGALEPIANRIEELSAVSRPGVGGAYREWIRSLPPLVGALLSVHVCISTSMAHGHSIRAQTLFGRVGRRWVMESRIRAAIKVNPMYMRVLEERIDKGSYNTLFWKRKAYNRAVENVLLLHDEPDLSASEYVQIGKYGVDAVWEAGLISKVNVDRSARYIVNPEIADYIMDVQEGDVLQVIAKQDTVMIHPPKTWKSVYDGGYLSPNRRKLFPMIQMSKVRKSIRQDIKENVNTETTPEVFKCLNFLQSVPYELHIPTRSLIMRIWESGGGALGVCTKEPPKCPEYPFSSKLDESIATDTELAVLRDWKAEAHDVLSSQMKEWKRDIQDMSYLVKSIRRPNQALWYPAFADTRGRMYYRGYPNPQGADFAKGVLTFNRKKPLGKRGMYWLKVHIANSAGFDKGTFDERVQWVDDNWKIISSALDCPEDASEVFIESPCVMFQAAWELREALRSRNPYEYLCSTPVHMDATMSGGQHFSMLLRDEVGGFLTNLVPNSGGKQDLYMDVAARATKLIQDDLRSTDPGIRRVAKWALSIGISRSMAKKPCMVQLYNAAFITMARHIQLTIQEEIDSKGLEWSDKALAFSDSSYITTQLIRGLNEAVPSAVAGMVFLKDVAREVGKDKPMSWVTPSGFRAYHDYAGHVDKKATLYAGGVTRLVIRNWSEDMDIRRTINAISPNFIHSMDASHAAITANRMNELGCDFVSIHDSFGTHPSDVDTLHRVIRESMRDMYKTDVLGNFLRDTGASTALPPVGNLDIEDIIHAKYMFC